MKKIIYSLVIMIAAGSLFTSCVTNTEPQGIKDLREAKADYIESLKNLKDADAARQKAALAYDEANWAYELQIKEIEVEIERVKADATIANKEAKIAEIVAQAKIAAIEYERQLAIAETHLQNTLDSIAVVSNKLSDEEKAAVKEYTKAYSKYLEALEKVHKAEAKVYDQNISTEDAHQAVRNDSAATVAQIAYYEELLKNLPDSGESINQGYELMDKFEAQLRELDYAWANCEKEWNLYKTTNLKDNIKGFADGLIEYVAQNAAIPAPFIMNFKTKLPDNEQVCRLMKQYIIHSPERFEGPAFLRFVNSVFVEQDAEGDYWLFANAYNAPAARALIWGYDFNDGSDYGSVSSLIEALNREFVVDSTKWLGIDSTGIKAAVAKAEKEYEDIEAALKNTVMKDEGVIAALTVWKNAAPENKAEAWNHVLDAKRDFYKNVYCKFWGIRYNSLPNFDPDKVCFNNPGRDSLEINFSLKEFTEPTPIVNFDFETMMADNDPFDPSQTAFLPYFEGEFYVPSTRGIFPGYPVDDVKDLEPDEATVFENYQKYIVDEQTILNQFKLASDFFGKTLLCKLLYKESVLAYVKSTADTQGTKEALAALQNEVLPSLEAAYYAADEAQSKNSEAFYKFISGLVGEDFLEELCDRIDNACKKASEFIPAIVIPETKYAVKYELKSELQRLLDYAQAIASGEQPSKKILISIFEDTMCGEFNSINTRILSLILTLTDEEDTRTTLSKVMAWFSGDTEDATMRMFMINTAYTVAYMGLQLGDAFAGDQFRALLSEVVTAYVNTRIDRIRSDYPNGLTTAAFSKQVLADYDNVIEMVLFGTERYYELYNALFLDKYTPSIEDMEEMETMRIAGDIQAQELVFNPVTDVVFSGSSFSKLFSKVFLRLCGVVSVKYIVSDFSGVLGDLEETYFTEWREKWEEYDLAMAEFAAQYEAIYAAKSVYAQYQNNISSLLDFEKGIYAKLYGDAVYDVDDDEFKDIAREIGKVEQKVKEVKKDKETSGLYAHLEDVCAFLEKIEAGYDGKTLYFETVQHELDEAERALELAKERLDLATKAYEQVLANHSAEDAE